MSVVDRIRTEYHFTAMVALDTFYPIAARVRNLLSHGRRLSMTQRFTYTGDAPRLFVGLSVDGVVQEWQDGDGWGLLVPLRPGLEAFGFSAYAADGNATEEQAWKRYHARLAESTNAVERRTDMTMVEVTGGRDGEAADPEDRIVIWAYGGDGVCDERVIAFDPGVTR